MPLPTLSFPRDGRQFGFCLLALCWGWAGVIASTSPGVCVHSPVGARLYQVRQSNRTGDIGASYMGSPEKLGRWTHESLFSSPGERET